MKVTKVEAIPFAIPYRKPLRFASGEVFVAEHVLVRVYTDTGLCLPFAVLEFKCTDPGAAVPAFPTDLGLRPVKVSKFLWSTGGGH